MNLFLLWIRFRFDDYFRCAVFYIHINIIRSYRRSTKQCCTSEGIFFGIGLADSEHGKKKKNYCHLHRIRVGQRSEEEEVAGGVRRQAGRQDTLNPWFNDFLFEFRYWFRCSVFVRWTSSGGFVCVIEEKNSLWVLF